MSNSNSIFVNKNNLECHRSWINDIEILSDTKVATVSEDNTIKIWDFNLNSCIRTIKSHTESVRSIIKIPNSTEILTTSWDETIKCHDFENFEMKYELKDDEELGPMLFLKQN